jgi:hypothetical protein
MMLVDVSSKDLVPSRSFQLLEARCQHVNRASHTPRLGSCCTQASFPAEDDIGRK